MLNKPILPILTLGANRVSQEREKKRGGWRERGERGEGGKKGKGRVRGERGERGEGRGKDKALP